MAVKLVIKVTGVTKVRILNETTSAVSIISLYFQQILARLSIRI